MSGCKPRPPDRKEQTMQTAITIKFVQAASAAPPRSVGSSFHSFSFGRYYDPNNMGYRSLRVINDDVVDRARLWQHGHDNMEIITWVIKGTLRHTIARHRWRDSPRRSADHDRGAAFATARSIRRAARLSTCCRSGLSRAAQPGPVVFAKGVRQSDRDGKWQVLASPDRRQLAGDSSGCRSSALPS